METWGSIVGLAIAFVGGSGFAKLVEIISDKISKAASHKRAEVDRIAKQLSASVAAENRLARRERIALEYISELRRLLLDNGVKSSELPVLDLGD